MGRLSLLTVAFIVVCENLFAQNPAGNAVRFDGNGDYVIINHDASLSITHKLSIAVWVKISSNGNAMSIVRKGGTNTPAYSLNRHSNNKFVFFVYIGGRWRNSGFSALTTTTLGNWYHVVGIYDGSEIKVYVNGVLDSSNPQTGTINTTTDIFSIGRDPNPSGEYFNGILDEVSVWNKALNESQLQAIMNDRLDPEYYLSSDSGLVAYWRFDELEDLGINGDGADDVRDFSINANHGDLVGNATLITNEVNLDSSLVAHWPFNGNANDESGNGNHGTVIGANLTTDRFGNDSSAYIFDGINDYIDLGNSLDNVWIPFSISVWIFKDQIGPRAQGFIVSDDSPNIESPYFGFWLSNAPNNKVDIGYGNGLGFGSNYRRSKESESSIPLNCWTHLVAIIRGPTEMSIFINAIDAGGSYGGTGSGSMLHNSWPARMGLRVGNNFVYFNGVMDDIRVYNRSLNKGEIDSLFAETITSLNFVKNYLPKEFELMQNYPNPFNSSTSIRYTIPKTKHVTLKIFNLMGREIETLVDSNQQFGEYIIKWNVRNLSSGEYFYRLKAGEFVETKKLLFLK